MARARRFAVAAVLLFTASLAQAGNYLFLSPPYLALTQDVIDDARAAAPEAFKGDAEAVAKLNAFADALETRVDEARRQQRLKKVKDEHIEETDDEAFNTALNDFKFAIEDMQALLPRWDAWNRLEVSVVKTGLAARLKAYRTRFGPESEPINLIEYMVSQCLLPGDESGPSAWEPIFRVSALQATTRGDGLTSTVQLGMNRYFLKRAPKPFRAVGIENHVGLAATLQYLDNPGILEVKGKPSFGLMVHLDRKEIGLAWNDDEDRLHLTIGYAFQFVPMVM